MASVEHCMYCFEVLAANLEKRTPMTLYQVVTSWAEYPKGLDDDDDNDDEENSQESIEPTSDAKPPPPTSSSSSANTRPRLATPTINRLAAPRSTSNSPSASSSSLLSASTSATTPSDSSSEPPTFTPIGIGRKTSQRSATISESPLFVTWNKASSSSGIYNLRGCIGTFESQSLSSGLASYALTSALHDTRFSPIKSSELPRLEVAVTLLTDFETCSDVMDWTLGVHGLRISFYWRNRRYGATYLPDVAVEQGWDKEETVISLMRKAGWGGREERWMDVGDMKVVRYQGKKESVEYEEYAAWRKWVERGREAAK